MHAAVIARETLRAGGFKPPKLDIFMLKTVQEIAKVQRDGKRSVFGLFKSMAVRKKRK